MPDPGLFTFASFRAVINLVSEEGLPALDDASKPIDETIALYLLRFLFLQNVIADAANSFEPSSTWVQTYRRFIKSPSGTSVPYAIDVNVGRPQTLDAGKVYCLDPKEVDFFLNYSNQHGLDIVETDFVDFQANAADATFYW